MGKVIKHPAESLRREIEALKKRMFDSEAVHAAAILELQDRYKKLIQLIQRIADDDSRDSK